MRNRIVAATIIAALIAATLALTTGTANAATKGFRLPGAPTLVSATCKTIDHNSWRITYKWRVKGGRYANWGSGGNFRDKPDNVWGGGTRRVLTHTTINGWGDGPAEAPTSAEATYSHYVAPIGASYRRMRDLHRTTPATFTCR